MAGYPSPRADAVAGNSTTVLMSPPLRVAAASVLRGTWACRLAESVHRPSPDPPTDWAEHFGREAARDLLQRDG